MHYRELIVEKAHTWGKLAVARSWSAAIRHGARLPFFFVTKSSRDVRLNTTSDALFTCLHRRPQNSTDDKGLLRLLPQLRKTAF